MHLPEQKHTFTNHLFIPPSEHHRLLRNDLELTSCHVVHLVLRAFGGVTRREIEVNPDLDVPRKTEFKHLWVQENQENSIC